MMFCCAFMPGRVIQKLSAPKSQRPLPGDEGSDDI